MAFDGLQVDREAASRVQLGYFCLRILQCAITDSLSLAALTLCARIDHATEVQDKHEHSSTQPHDRHLLRVCTRP